MMREDIRRARVEKYGSFLYCPDKDTLCSFLDNELAICPRIQCILEDPKHQAEQRRIERNRKKNMQNYVPEEKQANIRTQNKTRQQTILERIQREEALAARLYKKNRPNAAEAALMRARILKGELK